MNKIINFSIASLIAAVLPMVAFAQVEATMPALYNQTGQEVNDGNVTALPAGYYYLAPGGVSSQEVYYYGNGTYYDATTGTYGGSVTDLTGVAGASLGYNNSSTSYAPGVPDTGEGGDAPGVMLALIVSGAAAAAGVTYMIARRREVTLA